MPTSLANGSYQTLIKSVKQALTTGLLEARRLLEYQRVKTYWTIGRQIRLASEGANGGLLLNEALYQRISRDIEDALGLELTADTIGRTIQFAATYPEFPEKTPLTFTHYLALMRIDDDAARRKMEQKTIKEELSSTALKQKVLKLNAAPLIELATVKKGKLVAERGEPYVYALRSFEDLAGASNTCIDCGFKIHLPLGGAIDIRASSRALERTRYVRSVKKGERYEVRLAVRKRASLYTYAVRVVKVVDGDTLDGLIDVGFGIRVLERFRLKGIDAPELTTRAGQEAKKFLEEYLAKCPIIIARTMKAEMYGRWLGDIFALAGASDSMKIAAKGEYLNQLMLDKGMAKVYKE